MMEAWGMIKTKYFGASIILLAIVAAVLLSQKPGEAGVEVPGDLCLPGPGADCPPETSISYGPTNDSTVNLTTASFEFKGSDDITRAADLKFECRLDSTSESDWSACTSPKEYTGLSDGSHTFQVRAKDSAGKIDATPASRTWRVDSSQPPPPDTTPPETSITRVPREPLDTGSFEFTGRDNFGGTAVDDLKYECRFDSTSESGWSPCTSPQNYENRSNGSHTFEVRARDSAGTPGNVDATPASHTWRVDTTPPDTLILSHPSDPSNDATPTFRYKIQEDVSSSTHFPVYFCGYSLSGSEVTMRSCGDQFM